jgi:hypothetical protein
VPGIHPASRKQVQWAFASEARGAFAPKSDTPWTSPQAKLKRSLAREWAHRWKCWSWDEKARGKLPKDCKKAVELLDKIRSEHPKWKVPAGVKRPAPKPKVVPIRRPVRAPPVPIAARTARLPKKHADETFWLSLSSRQRHRALAAAYPQRDTGGWSISLPIDKRALAQARKLYGKQPKKRGPLPKPKTATPKRGKTKARRKPGALSADELVAEALAALR